MRLWKATEVVGGIPARNGEGRPWGRLGAAMPRYEKRISVWALYEPCPIAHTGGFQAHAISSSSKADYLVRSKREARSTSRSTSRAKFPMA